MSAILATIVRLIGWGGVLFVGLYVFEEGIPGASRIPFLSSIPIIGDLTTGRVHSYAADQVKFATAASDAKCGMRMQSMVSKFELDAVQAQLDKEKSDRLAAEQAATEAKKRADATQLAKQQADERIKVLQTAAKAAKLSGWSKEDLEWYEKH